ncbi:MAG: nitrogen fixation protein FixH [Ideonella sp.]|nr:nitrogen fixation protein FixH [Ideonella sp.]MCC7457717.1 hypothetical protein [Nitrospira sp.]
MNAANDRSPAGATSNAPTPWWRVGIVWLVLGGPVLVVVAGVATAVLAYRGADEVISTPSVAQAQTPADAATDMPALQARNRGAAAVPSKP